MDCGRRRKHLRKQIVTGADLLACWLSAIPYGVLTFPSAPLDTVERNELLTPLGHIDRHVPMAPKRTP